MNLGSNVGVFLCMTTLATKISDTFIMWCAGTLILMAVVAVIGGLIVRALCKDLCYLWRGR